MILKNALLTVLVASIVAVLVSAGMYRFLLAERPPEAAVTQASEPAAGPTEQARIEEVVRNYLLGNPEILIEMSNELDQRQQAAQEAHTAEAIAANADAIFRSETAPTVGSPEADVTVVTFFDYNCSFCRRAFPEVQKLVENDDKVRVVFKELPIFGGDSDAAAKAALAADAQGKYFEMHQRLLMDPGKADKDKAMRIAEDLGLDTEKLEADMESAEVQKALGDARDVADKIGLQGTPLYLIGDQMVPGAPEDLYDQLTQSVAHIREKGCRTNC
jgi:protein-disulfide isomerase